MKLITELGRVELTGDNAGHVSIWSTDSDSIVIKRYAERGNVTNVIANYESIDKSGASTLTPLTLDKAQAILARIGKGTAYSSSYIFYDGDYLADLKMMKSEMEHRFTSTGIKFWRHQEAMFNYKNDNPNSIISSHISPEGACNLKCPYCSVTYRDTHSRIPLDTIKDYVVKLQTRGLKAVILTGGGEPLAYPHANELIKWLKYERGVDIGLITNGTLTAKLDDDAWRALSWVRVSINVFKDWEKRIRLPADKLDPNCVVGASMVFTSEHEAVDDKDTDRLNILKRVAAVVDTFGAKYVRILPNCLLDQEHLFLMHRSRTRPLSFRA
jgi:organic radical activating enzyme